MSRTWRNIKQAPKGTKVPDGSDYFLYDLNGKVYYFNQDTVTIVRVRRPYFPAFTKNPLNTWKKSFFYKGNRKAKEIKRYIKYFRSPYTSKEEKEYRKENYKRYRKKCNQMIKKGNWDEIPRFTKTSGWLTW